MKKNKEYRMNAIEMLYQMDSKEYNRSLKSINAIIECLLKERKPEGLKPLDRYQMGIFGIIDRLDSKSIEEVYYFLVGYTGTSV